MANDFIVSLRLYLKGQLTDQPSRNELQFTARQLKRLELIEHLGGCCVRCGFEDPRALQVDHIDAGGLGDRARRDPYRMLELVRKDPKAYQLLCANCNWIKRYQNGEVARIRTRRYTGDLVP